MFASLHGILRDAKELKANGGYQEHLSFEIASVGGRIQFYVWTPKSLQTLSKDRSSSIPSGQFTPQMKIMWHERHHSVVYTSEIVLTDKSSCPSKHFRVLRSTAGWYHGTLAKLEDTEEEIGFRC
ncbi:hypothetical protein GWK75_01395 [Candidatus Saccharibacteria bacterium oral taxon 955]|nr:hypothetical protein GWK75_01395 [Candidatus Saccharibacteria bacterium oral taxon 955]